MQRKYLTLYLFAMLISIPLATALTPYQTLVNHTVGNQFTNLMGDITAPKCYVWNFTETMWLNGTADSEWSAFNITTWGDYGCNLSITVIANSTVFKYFNVTVYGATTPTESEGSWLLFQLYDTNRTHTITSINATVADNRTAYLFISKSTGTYSTYYFRFKVQYKCLCACPSVQTRIVYAVKKW